VKPTGGEYRRCPDCIKSDRGIKETILNGLRVIRIRFSIPYAELPELETINLGRYLQYNLGAGKERASAVFPRAQGAEDEHGLRNLKRLGRRQRWEFAHSVNSLKRNFPPGCRRHTPSSRSAWESRAFSSPPPTSPEYLAFCRKEVRKIFPFGWDSNYQSQCYSFVPRASSRFDATDWEHGSVRADTWWAERGNRKIFLDAVLSGRSHCSPLLEELDLRNITAKYKEVPTAGKCRPLLIFDPTIDLLGPLHKTIYGHLQKTDWLLSGPPTAKKLKSLKGRYHTSVDLVSATDNLPLDVTEVILGALLSKASQTPGAIRSMACNSLYPSVYGRKPVRKNSDGECLDDPWYSIGSVSHGQMMGGYLSFPLLCLQSHLAAKWASRSVPGHGGYVSSLVNGDDTIISTQLPLSEDSYPPGFLLNREKTIFNSEDTVEINSTVFLKRKGKCRSNCKWLEVPHLRKGGAPNDLSGLVHMAVASSRNENWSVAFIHSRIGRRWEIDPISLGARPTLPCYHRTCYLWDKYEDCRLPDMSDPVPDDPRLRSEWMARTAIPRGLSSEVAQALWNQPLEQEILGQRLRPALRNVGLRNDQTPLTLGEVRKMHRLAKPRNSRLKHPLAAGRKFGYRMTFAAWSRQFRTGQEEVVQVSVPLDWEPHPTIPTVTQTIGDYGAHSVLSDLDLLCDIIEPFEPLRLYAPAMRALSELRCPVKRT